MHNSGRKIGDTHEALPVLKYISFVDLAPIALGASFLGTGGGGDPTLGRLLAQIALERKGDNPQVEVIPPESLRDDDFTMMVAGMGSPSVAVEKLANLDDLELAVSAVERRLGREITAIVAAEMGGSNSLLPVAFAARRGVPVIDADGMGRAFPELQMVTFHVEGNSPYPMAVIGDAGQSILIESAPTTADAERLARPLCVAMGGRVTLAGFAMDGKAARRSVVPGTLSLAHAIGAAMIDGRRAGDPFAALFACLARSPYYQHYARIGEGRIIDVNRRIERGWTIGICTIQTPDGELEVVFRNEYLIARRDGQTLVIVPDLIVLLDADTASPLTTSDIKYGQRVVVVATSAAACMRTPKALAVFGPKMFGFDEEFVPLEQRLPL